VLRFGDDVQASDREFIQSAASWTQRYWGQPAGSVTVYAYTTLDALLYAFTQDCACPSQLSTYLTLFRSELAFPGHFTTTAQGAMLVWVYSEGWRQSDRMTGGAYDRLRHLTHTQFHSIQRALGIGRTDPPWIAEGSAEYSMARVMAANGRMNFQAERASIASEVASMTTKLSDLEERTFQAPVRAPYALGFLAAEYLASKYGEQSILTYWRSLGAILKPRYDRGDYAAVGAWQEAFGQAFGLPVAEFYRQFEMYRAGGFVLR